MYQPNHGGHEQATSYEQSKSNNAVLTENGYGVMGPPVQNQNQQDGYMHMIPNDAAAVGEDVYSQAQAQVSHQQQSNEYYMMGQQYYNYEAAGRIFPFFENNITINTVCSY